MGSAEYSSSAMPPASRVSRLAMFNAQIMGEISRVSNNEKLKLTGEKLTVAIAGDPTVNCHQGINTETAIKIRVSMPAANATWLICFAM